MQRCIDLARNGKGNVAPNPMVGSVIVHNDRIIGEGCHLKYGEPHAEVNAINSVKNKDLLQESTLFVNLEPCSHQGKTPPCSDLIISHKIREVVIGTIDPNSLVAGKGIEKLKKSGVNVVLGVLEEQCLRLNKRFFTFHMKKRPYVILKWAQSGDSFLDIDRADGSPIGPNWISNPVSRMLVHKWRSHEGGIMVGTNTVMQDNPGLDTRLWPGKSPIRILLDRQCRIPVGAKVLDGSVPTIVFNSEKNTESDNLQYYKVDFNENILKEILGYLYHNDVQSIIVEGGRQLLQSFIDDGLWDEARVFIGDNDFKNGVPAPELKVSPGVAKNIMGDNLTVYLNN